MGSNTVTSQIYVNRKSLQGSDNSFFARKQKIIRAIPKHPEENKNNLGRFKSIRKKTRIN
jgi:hypothetical protein